MYLVQYFLLNLFLVVFQNHWITFTYGFLNEKDLSFKPTLIAVDKTTGDVYAAGSIYLARLTSNLTLISQIETSSCKSCEIRVLEIDYKTRKLLVCGVTEKGSCAYHRLDNISKSELLKKSKNDKSDNIGRNGSVVALFLPPSQGKHSELVMGISQPLETQFDLLSFRKITSKRLTYSAGSNVKLRISKQFRRDVKVHFVYGFQFKNGSYFLVNKRDNNGTSSWIFRIFYNETSVYPFVAIPLSCQDRDTRSYLQNVQKYNLAIAATYYNSSLVVSFGYNSNKESHIPDSWFGSSLCLFKMEDITGDMDFISTQYCGIHPTVSTSEWIMGHGTVGYRDNTNSSCNPGYNKTLEATVETSDYIPIKVEDNKLITSVIPFHVDNQLHIIISTNHGDLYYRKNREVWFKIPNNGNQKGFLADVAINTNDMTAYTITENKIVKLSLDYCQPYLDCSSCVLNDRMFNCKWFKGQCVATGRNTGGLEFTCPPEITSIFPNHGLISRNNLITIQGNYLGKSVGANRSVTVCTVPCIVNVTLSNTSQIVCKTERKSKEEDCPVTVEINDKESSPHMKGSVTSGDNPKLYFHFKSVSITSFNPELGPESGGTYITVIGENLDLTQSVQIKIKDLPLPCKIISSNNTILLCTTQSLKQSPQNRNTNESIGCGRLLFMIRNDVIAETYGTFCYWNDPQITNVHPRRSIRSGGLDVIVGGTNLNVIAYPRFGITLDNSEVQPETEACKIRSSTIMICKTPKLTSLVPNDTTISGDIFFLMDGVQELKDFANHHPNLSEIKVNPDPVFSSISNGGLVDNLKNTLSIKGTNIKESEVDNGDIQVTISGDGGTSITCPVTKLGEQEVSCAPKPTSTIEDTFFVVQVKVGNRYYKVGNIFVNAKGNRGLGLPNSPQKIKQYGLIVGVAFAVVVCIFVIILVLPTLYEKFLKNLNRKSQGFELVNKEN